MITKTLKLNLGGEERTLLFGIVGYFSYIKEATGKDPFDYLEEVDKNNQDGNIILLIEDVAIVAYAGINSYLDSVNKENVSKETVRKWCNGLTLPELSEIFKTAITALSEGKLIAQPEQGSA